MVKIKRFFAVPLLLAVALLFGCNKKEISQLQGKTMGTHWQVKIADEISEKALFELKNTIEKRLLAINQEMSTYIPDSRISQFNSSLSTEPFEISEDFAKVIQKALLISEQSNGLYDITVQPLVSLWGFSASKIKHQPSKEAIEEALRAVGYQKIHLENKYLRKDNPKIQIDLSSIAKGYGTDEIAKILENAQFQNYLVEIGGEIVVKGTKFGSAWTVGIEKPTDGKQQAQEIISLQNQALATSGNYRNFIDFDGIRAVHTINPQTGEPKISSLLSATVIADDCMTADGYATALMVQGEQAIDFMDKYQLKALLIFADGQNFKVIKSKAFLENFK